VAVDDPARERTPRVRHPREAPAQTPRGLSIAEAPLHVVEPARERRLPEGVAAPAVVSAQDEVGAREEGADLPRVRGLDLEDRELAPLQLLEEARPAPLHREEVPADDVLDDDRRLHAAEPRL